ncbi:GntP family permease [Sporolactobacillus pectinivorans]|uniref:GntP family permease n=1 Tax=Sporolactobacillus pectinivorans TaxID=1591408 RepID=UPI000C258C21|nr:gluconate:H+ symporter [Sporolactobacillus pectinivorans]
MTSHDVLLLTIAIFSILLLIFLIVSRLHMHPLLALLIVSVGVGIASGIKIQDLAASIEAGAGNTLGGVGLTVALGAMFGKILADSGVSNRIASQLLSHSNSHNLPWLMALAAFIIGIPMFFEVGLIILLPLIFTVARKVEKQGKVKGSPYIMIGVPVIAALASMHGMVPPHPGPLVAINGFKANLGMTMIYGIICAIPAIILAGPLYARFIAPRLSVRPDEQLMAQYTTAIVSPTVGRHPVSKVTAWVVTLLPMIMMLIRTLAQTLLHENSIIYQITAFIGDPVMAMLIGLLVAIVVLGYARGEDGKTLRTSLGNSLKPIAGILLIIAGGGAFAKVLVDSHVGDAIVHLSSTFSLPAIVLGWVIAALLSVTTGSATVGIVGATGLLAPMIAANPGINTSLLVVAIGSGSLFFNYANHAGFWLVKESFGMTMGETFKTITVIQSIVGLVGLIMALVLNMFPVI